LLEDTGENGSIEGKCIYKIVGGNCGSRHTEVKQ